ncbi:MAG: RagB/SusD family nutrient uptake outer membrane protein [Bacteroidaceae bacterium]|nr:RagB/SusD family nutrient uptake outer membrane protein [Bacteroidaceae bacterium]
MKAKYILSSAILSGILATSCVDLDTAPMSAYVTTDQKTEIVESDPTKAEAGVNAIFSQFNVYMGVTGSRHNDFGYPSIMLFSDANGHDIVSQDNGYNWISSSMEYSDRVYTSNESKIVWNTMYSMIYSANNVVASVVDPQDPTAKYYLGQALSSRAFNYFILAQLYQFNYADHKSSPCVPLVTDENALTVAVDGAGRATVEEVYSQIMADLNRAIELFTDAKAGGVKRADKRYFDLGVALGLRARVNLTMENWSAAAADAQAAIDASGATPYSIAQVSVPTFMDSNDAAWMWGDVIAETDRVVTSGIVNWASHTGSLNYGYANFSGGFQINKALYNTIPDSDVRKGWWTDENGISRNLDEEQQDFMTNFCGYAPHTHVKFAPYNNEVYTSTNAGDIPLMRVEEMYLIKAEGEAMSGNTAAGKTTLENFVKTYRDPEYTCAAASAQEMQDEIWRQRRIELWGEGLSWYDIMRLNKDVDRRGGAYPDVTMVYHIPAGSDILLWRIPESEIQANPAMEESDNNPSASKPEPVVDYEY